MKITVVTPTYWTSHRMQNQIPDVVFDHPTDLMYSGTLPRLLKSLKNVVYNDTLTLVVIPASTHGVLENVAEAKTEHLIAPFRSDFPVINLSIRLRKRICASDSKLAPLLLGYGYSTIRNFGLVVAQILDSDILVFLDDDVIVTDQDYFIHAKEHIGQELEGRLLGGIAGYYVDRDGGYEIDEPRRVVAILWSKERKMNEAFKILQSTERLTETTFAFGGNMVLHWRMFEQVPFDPWITRGEDMDFLVNAKGLGFRFLLDTGLAVVHAPEEGKKLWSEMRQDLYRFLYMRRKLLHGSVSRLKEQPQMNELGPYPGHFLTRKTLLSFTIANTLQAINSLQQGNIDDFYEFIRNLAEIPGALHFAARHFSNYPHFQRKWSQYVPKIRGNRRLRQILRNE